MTVRIAAVVRFTPCTGFGDMGRTATLSNEAGDIIGMGQGATDDEAVVEALIATGLAFDWALDLCGSVIRRATIIRD